MNNPETDLFKNDTLKSIENRRSVRMFLDNPVSRVDRYTGHDFFRIMEIQSSAAAVQNLLISATSLGLATVWPGVLVLIKKDVLKFLGEPEGEFMAVVPVGYAAKPSASPARQPVDMLVRYL